MCRINDVTGFVLIVYSYDVDFCYFRFLIFFELDF